MSTTPYEVFAVPTDARESDEPVGSKRKFWFTRDDWPWMFKASRHNTGEDWAEVVAAELCDLLGLPHARYEFGVWSDHKGHDYKGIVTPKFLPSEEHGLVLGNEVMAGYLVDYPKDKKRQELHTLEAVLKALEALGALPPENMELPDGVETAGDVLLGYFIFDAFIGNSDRHHENWGVIKPKSGPPYLAPTFDHASSMGRELMDNERHERRHTRDAGRTVEVYARRCESALFRTAVDQRPMKTRKVVELALSAYPTATRAWIMKIAALDEAELAASFQRIPASWISAEALAFAMAVLHCNSAALRQLLDGSDG